MADELDLSEIKNGDSVPFAEGTLLNIDYQVQVKLQVINTTRWPMLKAHCEMHGGVLMTPVDPVFPGYKECS